MNRPIISIAALVLVLSACSGGEKDADSDKAVSIEDAAARAAGGQPKLEPGKYEVTTRLLEFEMAGMPAGQAETMKSMMGGEFEKPHSYCLTAEEAEEGPRRMVSHLPQGDCRMVDFSATSNSVSGEMQCAVEGGASGTTRFAGTFASDSSSMTMESDQQLPGLAGKGMHMKMRVDSRRVGECTA
jgi:hypothetical protein